MSFTKQSTIIAAAVCCLVSGLSAAALAKVIKVPEEYATIREALEKARSGDEIKVGKGVYQEGVVLNKDVTLSAENAQNTVLTKVTDLDRPLVIIEGNAALVGFTLMGGNGGSLGAVYVPGGSPTISLNLIHDNDSMAIVVEGGSTPTIKENLIYANRGSGIQVAASKPHIINNEIYQNFGAGIYAQGAAPRIENNRIYKNSESGISISYGASMGGNVTSRVEGEALILNNKIEGNSAAGIIAENTSPNIVGNTISNKGRPGLLLFASSAIIQKNTLISSGPPAIHINPGASPIITDNTISGTRRFPILGDTSTATIKNNKVENSWQPKFYFK